MLLKTHDAQSQCSDLCSNNTGVYDRPDMLSWPSAPCRVPESGSERRHSPGDDRAVWKLSHSREGTEARLWSLVSEPRTSSRSTPGCRTRGRHLLVSIVDCRTGQVRSAPCTVRTVDDDEGEGELAGVLNRGWKGEAGSDEEDEPRSARRLIGELASWPQCLGDPDDLRQC